MPSRGVLQGARGCEEIRRIWVEITGRRAYYLPRVLAPPRSLLWQRHAHPGGPRVRSASTSTSVEALRSQRTPHFLPDWIGERGLYWRVREIGLEVERGGSKAFAGGARGAHLGRRTACEKLLIWVEIIERDHNIYHKHSPRLGRCFGSEMRTPAGRDPLGSAATSVAV